MNINKKSFLFDDIDTLKGVGFKTKKHLERKKIEKIKDLLWDLPYSVIDRSKISSLDELEIGKILTIKVKVEKYNFPRIRNLPNKVICSENGKKINIIFFNSYEGYIKKILPIGKQVIISGKINFYNKNYQITNPNYVKLIEKKYDITKIFPKYSLTEGLNDKKYRKLINDVLNRINENHEWHNDNFLKKNNFNKFKQTFVNLHNPSNKLNILSNDYKRLAYDEIFANFLTLLSARKTIKTKKKIGKIYNNKFFKVILKNFTYDLTEDQKKIMKIIDRDLKSKNRMFRLLQGDVGSGKTILAMIAAGNVIESGYQVALMAPTEILASQHYELSKKLFYSTNVKIDILTSKTSSLERKIILKRLEEKKIDFLIGTHSLFQKKINFIKLGFIIIDEQHKFGVKQRILLAKKGGRYCDILSMSATPIPRTMMLSFFGDMDVSVLSEKPKNRKPIITLIKPDNKISELWPFIKKEIDLNRQVFWVCPLIDESKNVKYSSAVTKFNFIKNIFPGRVGLIHGNLNQMEKNKTLNNFLKKKINILVSTTVIEVGINFPDANVMVIENSNKFGLSQLHQLRGRVGRGNIQSYCILFYNKNLSEKAKKRLKILRKSNDGFFIAEEDLKIRGHGDLLGFQQSGLKNFHFADPVHHKDLFLLAENNIKNIKYKDIKKYENLIKLYDRAEIINEIAN